MAVPKQTIPFDITITGEEAALSIDKAKQSAKELKQEIKNLSGTGTADISKLNNEFDKLGSVQRAESILKVSEGIAGGFAAIQGAMALAGGESEELTKTLLKVQSALAISQGVKAVTEGVSQMGAAFDTLKKVILANPLVTILAVTVTAVTTAMYLLTRATDEQTEALNEQIKINKEKFEAIEKGYDREIALARANGKETLQLEKEKLQATIQRITKELELEEKKNQILIKNQLEFAEGFIRNEDLVKELRERSKKKEFTDTEEIKKLREDLSQASIDLEVKEAEIKKKAQDDYKAAQEKRKKDAEDTEKLRIANLQKQRQDELDRAAEEREAYDLKLKDAEDFENARKKQQEDALKFSAEIAAAQQAIDKETQEKKRAELEATKTFEQEQLAQGLNIATAFFDTQLTYRLRQAEGNEAEQEKIRRKFFERQKKVQIAQALMSTYQGASNAFTATAANIPLTAAFPAAPYIAAASATALGLLNVRKIAQTQFEGGITSGGSSVSAPSLDNAGGNNRGFNEGNSTTINDDGSTNSGQNVFKTTPQPTKVYVVASEVDNVNNLNKQITKLSTV